MSDAASMMLVESNSRATARQAGGVTGRGFLPGRSGNPGGRAKGITAYARKQTENGRAVVDFLVAVMENRVPDAPRISIKYRLEAARELLDRGFGKAVQQTELSGPSGGPLPLTVIPFDYQATVAELSPPDDSPGQPGEERAA